MQQATPPQDDRGMAHQDDGKPEAAGEANRGALIPTTSTDSRDATDAVPNYAGFPLGVPSRLIGMGEDGGALGTGIGDDRDTHRIHSGSGVDQVSASDEPSKVDSSSPRYLTYQGNDGSGRGQDTGGGSSGKDEGQDNGGAGSGEDEGRMVRALAEEVLAASLAFIADEQDDQGYATVPVINKVRTPCAQTWSTGNRTPEVDYGEDSPRPGLDEENYPQAPPLLAQDASLMVKEECDTQILTQDSTSILKTESSVKQEYIEDKVKQEYIEDKAVQQEYVEDKAVKQEYIKAETEATHLLNNSSTRKREEEYMAAEDVHSAARENADKAAQKADEEFQKAIEANNENILRSEKAIEDAHVQVLPWATQVIERLDESELAKIDVPRLTEYLTLKWNDTIYFMHHNLIVASFRFLRSTVWIDDQTINFCLESLLPTSPRQFTLLNSAVFGSAVESRIKTLKIFVELGKKSGLLIAPLNHGNSHWLCFIFDFERNERWFFDPLQSSREYNYLKKVSSEYFAEELAGIYEGMKENKFKDFEQKDAVNCGLYTIEFVDHYIHDTLSSFRVSDNELERVQHSRLMYLNLLLSNCSRTPPKDLTEVKVKIEDIAGKKKIHKRGGRGPRKVKREEGTAKKPQPVYSTSEESEPIRGRKSVVGRIPESEQESSSSAPPSPTSAQSVTPYPKLKGTKMSKKTMEIELAKFIHRYRRQTVDLRLATAYLTNHIDQTNRQWFIDLYHKLAGMGGEPSGKNDTQDKDKSVKNENAAGSTGGSADDDKPVKNENAAGSTGGGAGGGSGGGGGSPGRKGDDAGKNESDDDLDIKVLKFQLKNFIRNTLADKSVPVPSTSAMLKMAEQKLDKTIDPKLFHKVFQDVKKDVMEEQATRAKLKAFVRKRESNLPPSTSHLRKEAETEFGIKIGKRLFSGILAEWDEEKKIAASKNDSTAKSDSQVATSKHDSTKDSKVATTSNNDSNKSAKKRKADSQGQPLKLFPLKKSKTANQSKDEAGSKNSDKADEAGSKDSDKAKQSNDAKKISCSKAQEDSKSKRGEAKSQVSTSQPSKSQVSTRSKTKQEIKRDEAKSQLITRLKEIKSKRDETKTPSKSQVSDETKMPSRSQVSHETKMPSRSQVSIPQTSDKIDESKTPSRSQVPQSSGKGDETKMPSRSQVSDETKMPSRSQVSIPQSSGKSKAKLQCSGGDDDDHDSSLDMGSPDSDTDSDAGASERAQRQELREGLMLILQSNKLGTPNAKVFAEIRPVTKLSTTVIKTTLEAVGEFRSNLWFLKPTLTRTPRVKTTSSSQAATAPKPPCTQPIKQVTSPKPTPSLPPSQSPTSLALATKKRPSSEDSSGLSGSSGYGGSSSSGGSSETSDGKSDGGKSDDSKWSVKKRKRLKQKTADEIEAEMVAQLAPGKYFVENVVDVRRDNGVKEYKVQWFTLAGKKRPPASWIPKSYFDNWNQFKDQAECVERWKKSGLSKAKFYKTDSKARQWLDLTKLAGADGDGWCSFRAVGMAIELLTGRDLVTTQMITDWEEQALKRNPYRTELKCGTKWPELLAFIRNLCSKKIGFDIPLDFEVLSKNHNVNISVGLDRLAKCRLVSGIYIMAGFYPARDAGHCVVLEINDDRVLVHEEDCLSGVESLDWLHEVTYVRQFKLKDK